jgi:hypothetical protein
MKKMPKLPQYLVDRIQKLSPQAKVALRNRVRRKLDRENPPAKK